MGSIFYIDLPLRGTNKSDGHDVLVVALVVTGSLGDNVQAVSVRDDGDMAVCPVSEININWRFHDGRRKWLDVDTGEELGGDDEGDDSQG